MLLGALPFSDVLECKTPNEVGEAADRLGYPVVVKAIVPDLVHKSDYGLVRTSCADAEAARAAATDLGLRAASQSDAVPVFLVEPQLRGVELAVGVRRDELGPVCMVAAGGTLVEILDDVAVRFAPIARDEALEMLQSLRIWPVLEGYRGTEPVELESLLDLVVTVSELAEAVPEIAELDLNPVFASAMGCLAADARCVLATPCEEELAPNENREAVRMIFEPRRIAVVGASRDTQKVGGLVLHYLRKHGWAGEIVAVNRKPLDLDGIATFPSLRDVKPPVDLACIAVPASAVASIIDDCVVAGVPAGIIFSSGFADSGDDGSSAQDHLRERAAGRFRFVGPNTNGIASPADDFFATFGMALEAPSIASGETAFVSHSGAIASSLISRSSEFGIGFSHWVSTGNEADLDVADYVDYLADDERTRVICLFLETVRRPRAFANACARALNAGKPVIALKTGSSEAGRAAAISHTGALTGTDAAYRAFLDRCGVVQVRSLPALLAAARGLLSLGGVAGNRVAVVSMSGGACSILADACSEAGLDVAPLDEETQAFLRQTLPSFGGVRNPIDVTAAGITNPELVRRTIEIVRQSGGADLILLQLSTNADPAATHIAHDLVDLGTRSGTPFLVGRLGAPSLAPNAMKAYLHAGVHVFSWPEQLVAAAQACVQYGAGRQQL
jgi:acyl-CoA synthetase (NDP forming)